MSTTFIKEICDLKSRKTMINNHKKKFTNQNSRTTCVKSKFKHFINRFYFVNFILNRQKFVEFFLLRIWRTCSNRNKHRKKSLFRKIYFFKIIFTNTLTTKRSKITIDLTINSQKKNSKIIFFVVFWMIIAKKHVAIILFAIEIAKDQCVFWLQYINVWFEDHKTICLWFEITKKKKYVI